MRCMVKAFGVFVGILIVLLIYGFVTSKHGECAYQDIVIHYDRAPSLFGLTHKEWIVMCTLDGQDFRVESQDSATAFETIHILIDRSKEEPIITEAPWFYVPPSVDQVYYSGCRPITVDTISCDHDFACGEFYPAHCPLLGDPYYFESQIPDCPLLESE